jgi:hypothetical protein
MCTLFISMFVAAASPAGLSDGLGSCPGTGDCCVANGTPGCDNTTCCDLVCTAEPNCCLIGWSQSCVDQALSLCGDVCTASGCPGTESCCESHASPGCDDEECCERVCVANPNCCSSVWSGSCVTAAQALCGSLCNVFDACSEDNPNSCCRDNQTEGCRDVECCANICSRDPFCCNSEWDDLCVGLAVNFCGKADGDYCWDEWCPDEGSCCTAHGTPGAIGGIVAGQCASRVGSAAQRSGRRAAPVRPKASAFPLSVRAMTSVTSTATVKGISSISRSFKCVSQAKPVPQSANPAPAVTTPETVLSTCWITLHFPH